MTSVAAQRPSGRVQGSKSPSPRHLVLSLFGREFPLPHCQPVLHMFGLQPGLLLRHYGLGQRYGEALDLIESTWARSWLPPTIGAFSLAATPDGSSRAVSLFASAGVLFGSDANIRRTLLKLGRKRDWNLSLYEAVSASIEGHKDPSTRHGIIAWIVSNRGPAELRIGLRPAKELTRTMCSMGKRRQLRSRRQFASPES